jgi:hypothetical protein
MHRRPNNCSLQLRGGQFGEYDAGFRDFHECQLGAAIYKEDHRPEDGANLLGANQGFGMAGVWQELPSALRSHGSALSIVAKGFTEFILAPQLGITAKVGASCSERCAGDSSV